LSRYRLVYKCFSMEPSPSRNSVAIMNNPELDPKVKMDAAKWLIERIMGKTPDVTVTIDEKRYEKLFDRLERGADRDSSYVVEGELISDGREP
jgi:hypothetical protein